MQVHNVSKLLEIAKLQKQFLSYIFDFENFKEIDDNDCDQRCERILNRLDALRSELEQEIIQRDGYCGIYWWNIPESEWGAEIMTSLDFEEEYGNWRIESKLCHTMEKDHRFIYITEEGHYTSFDESAETSYEEVSKYTAEERRDMVNSLNRKITDRENYNIFTTEGRVYSERYGKTYDSATDYYNSLEYNLDKKWATDFYESTLKDEVETTYTTIRSNSLHYKSAFSFAGYSLDNEGGIDGLEIRPFRNLGAHGNGKEHAGQSVIDRSEKVLCAAFLANSREVKHISADIFGELLTKESSNLMDAAVDSAVLTLLSDKLEGDTVSVPDATFDSKEQMETVCEIADRINRDEEVSRKELIMVYDAVNKNLLGLDDVITSHLKAVYPLLLSTKCQNDKNAQLWYLEKSKSVTENAMRRFPESMFLKETAVRVGAILGEIYLKGKNKDKEKAKECCELALSALVEVKKHSPESPVLQLEKPLNKFYSKSMKKGFWFF